MPNKRNRPMFAAATTAADDADNDEKYIRFFSISVFLLFFFSRKIVNEPN